MDFHYSFVYLIVNIVCFCSAIVILSRLSSSIGSETENKILRMMLFAYMAFLVCEILWIMGVSGMISLSPFATGLIKVAGTAFIPIKVYYWLQYAEANFENTKANTRKFKLITAIPVIIMLLIYITSIWTGAVASVDETGAIVFGPAIGITGVVDNIYGIAVVVHAIILLIRDKDGFNRRIYVTHILFITICTAGGIVDAVVSDTPVMPLAIMLSLNVLFINLQESKIFNDALTGLNNRRLADRYISSAISECDPQNPSCLFMMDIDNFKTINDQYGHVQGDIALKSVAEALKEAVAEYRGFLARWGGDEFVAFLKVTDSNTVDNFKLDVKNEIEKIKNSYNLPFNLAISTGHEICDDGSISMSDLINKADEQLYEAKANKDKR